MTDSSRQNVILIAVLNMFLILLSSKIKTKPIKCTLFCCELLHKYCMLVLLGISVVITTTSVLKFARMYTRISYINLVCPTDVWHLYVRELPLIHPVSEDNLRSFFVLLIETYWVIQLQAVLIMTLNKCYEEINDVIKFHIFRRSVKHINITSLLNYFRTVSIFSINYQ